MFFSLDSSFQSSQEAVVLCGHPASGKSTFFKRFFEPHGYVHVNRDTLGTDAKCVKGFEEALIAKKSAVVDNTNPASESRIQYASLASKHGILELFLNSVKC